MIPDESQLIPDESQLINQFARGNGSVFVGAGLSVGAGLPGWADLVKPLAQKVNSPEGSSYPDIAQYYVNLNDKPTLVNYVLSKLRRPGFGPTEIHKQLAKLPVSRIFTTNYDRLLEDAFNAQGLSIGKIVTDEHLALMDSPEKSLIKIHGDLEQPESWVLTSDDYDNYFSNHPGIANLLGMDLHSRTVLFLGYSFNDIDLRMILSRVKRVAGRFRKNLFAVQFNSTSLEVEELKRRGVRVIGLKAKAGRLVSTFTFQPSTHPARPRCGGDGSGGPARLRRCAPRPRGVVRVPAQGAAAHRAPTPHHRFYQQQPAPTLRRPPGSRGGSRACDGWPSLKIPIDRDPRRRWRR